MSRVQNTAAIHRSIRAMTIGTLRAHETRKRRDALEALAEMDQQFQLPIAGNAGTVATWFEVDVDFAATFVLAPEMRESPYEDPLFTYGAVVAAPVFVTANVTAWKTDSSDNYVGATVNIGVAAPGTLTLVQFRGHVHCNFQGYGAVDEADNSED